MLSEGAVASPGAGVEEAAVGCAGRWVVRPAGFQMGCGNACASPEVMVLPAGGAWEDRGPNGAAPPPLL